MVLIVGIADNEMNVHMGYSPAGEPAVATAGAKTVVVQVIQVAELPANLPELSEFLIPQVQQVSYMSGRNYQQMQPSAGIRKVVMGYSPVLSVYRYRLQGWLRAEYTNLCHFKSFHFFTLLWISRVTYVIQAHLKLPRSSRMNE